MENLGGENLSENELNFYYKIRKTVLQMLSDRGYVVSSEEKERSLEQFKYVHRNRDSLSILTAKARVSDSEDFEDELIYVEFNPAERLGVEQVTNFAQRLQEQKIKNGIFVLKGTITALAKQVKIEKYLVDFYIIKF